MKSNAENLVHYKSHILKIWEEQVRKSLPGARHESRPALRDHIPDFLDYLSEALFHGINNVRPDIVSFAHHHGAERALLSAYTVEEALSEYNILRKVIFTVLEEHQPLTPAERDIIYEGINLGLSKAASEYHQMQVRQIEKSEEKFRILFNHAPVGIAEVDFNTRRFMKVNPKYCEMLGYSEEEFLKLNVVDITHPEDIHVDNDKFDLLKSGEISGYRREKRYIKKDGTIIWAEISVTTFFSRELGAPFNIAVAIDITDRKKAEADLNLIQERFERATEFSKIGVWELDIESKKIWRSFSHDGAFGVHNSDEVWTEDFYLQNVHPDDKKCVSEALEKAISTPGKHQWSCRIIWTDKSIHWISLIAETLTDFHGKPVKVIGTNYDITDLKNTMDALQKSEQDFRNLADALPQLVWIAEADGKTRWYNERWVDFSGKSIDELKTRGWQNLLHPDFFEQSLIKYKQHMMSGKTWEETFPLHAGNGEWRWFLSRAIPIKNEKGEIYRWIGTNTDITEQKKILDALQEETVLRQKFVSTLSHDLRTPLTAAKMSAELIKRKSSDDTLINLSVRISDNLTRANVMIEDLLDASKIRAGQSLSPIFQNFNLTELLNKTIEDLTSIHGDRFILIAPDELMVWQDPNGIRRVIENLCTNAIKYGSPVEKIRIKLDHGNKRMMVCVHNEGNPLMNIDKSRLFEPFQRGPEHATAGKKGWGIGLTIVKGITEAHHGEVSVESSENGTTFKILLPLDARPETDMSQSFLS